MYNLIPLDSITAHNIDLARAHPHPISRINVNVNVNVNSPMTPPPPGWQSDVRALRGLYDQYGPALTNRMLPDGTGTLLHYACRKAKRKAVAFLCEAGADPNNVDGDGETPLFWLATIARFDSHTVEMLEAMVTVLGADINHRDYLGRVALTYACVRGTVDQVRRRRVAALLKLGADPRLRDYDEKAPVDYLGMCTNGGMWMDALPENEREMRRCRALLLVGRSMDVDGWIGSRLTAER